MARRFHVSQLRIGDNPLDATQAHHARDVLRLPNGSTVEIFDDAGAIAEGILTHVSAGVSLIQVAEVHSPNEADKLTWAIAAAVPKGDRADWMVEKLSELGASAFVPLAAARSVVRPEGKSKRERWMRIATEAAKQSRRPGVMRIGELTSLQSALRCSQEHNERMWVLTTEAQAPASISKAVLVLQRVKTLTAFIGPEGGWTSDELAAFAAAGATAVRLGETILRVETAAVVVGGILASMIA